MESPRPSGRKALIAGLVIACAVVVLTWPAVARAAVGDVTLCSVTASGARANNDCGSADVTPDGRYVVFVSSASNLVPGSSHKQVYRKDLVGGGCVKVSTSHGGTQGNADSAYPSVSADGRLVVFESTATNLASRVTSHSQIFSKDLETGTVSLISRNGAGTQGNGNSYMPRMTPDGRYVVFQSASTNLVSFATAHVQVFRRDLSKGTVTVVSRNAAGLEGDSDSNAPAITPDGRYVAFHSSSTNLVGPATVGWQVFRKDMSGGGVVLASRSATGVQGAGTSEYPTMSYDGRFVAFESMANNLVTPATAGWQVFRKDLTHGTVKVCSSSSAGAYGTGNSYWSRISYDGRYVSFYSASPNLVSPATAHYQVFRKDVNTGGIELVSSSKAGSQGNGDSAYPAMTPVGRFVVFDSLATNLVSPATAHGQVFRRELSMPKCTVASVSPASGAAGTTVTIDVEGAGFCPGAGMVLRKDGEPGVEAASTEVTSPAAARSTFDLAGVTPGHRDLVFVNADGQEATVEGGFDVFASIWYLAEGTTGWGFSTYFSVENPNTEEVSVRFTYMTSTGPVDGGTFKMPAGSQLTIDPNAIVPGKDFSTKVECVEGAGIAVDRTMTWTGAGASCQEAHTSVGVNSAAKTWYLPEGSSKWGFECWLLLQNPNDEAANCRLTYMIEGAAPVVVEKNVPANSRATFNMKDDIGEQDASVMVEGDMPVIPERAMYRNDRREGHDSIGTTSPATDYYLAEGTTDWGFTTYVLVQNPNDTAVDVTVTYMMPDGDAEQPVFQMPANSRKTIRVNDIMPETDLSTKVHGTRPIIAERAMYWNGGPDYTEACHDSIGLAAPHAEFFLPDGQASDGHETWTLVQNPNDEDVTVRVSYLTADGAGNATFDEVVPRNGRRTFNMADRGITTRAAVRVTCLTSGRKIMVERAMYWSDRGAGTDTIGGYTD